eukprot:scaffold1658_cov393-Prasinococcus_capsulatus_cf.AAC.2
MGLGRQLRGGWAGESGHGPSCDGRPAEPPGRPPPGVGPARRGDGKARVYVAPKRLTPERPAEGCEEAA